MSKLTELMAEATKILAKDLGKTEKEVLSEYSSKYGTGLADKLLEDSKVLSKGSSAYKEVPADQALTTIVNGPAVPVGQAKDVPSDFTKGKPIGGVSSPAASSRAGKSLVPYSGLAETVNSGQLALPPPPKGAGPTVNMPFQETAPVGAVGEIKAKPSKAKAVLGAAGAATVAGAYGMSGNEEPPVEPAPAEIAKQVSDKELSSKISNVAKAKSPADYTAVVASFRAPLEKLGEEEKALFETKLNDLNNKLSEAQGKYEKDKDRTAWSEVAERVGFALAQIGAGLHGLNTGVDISGMKFSPTNWEARYDRSLAELKNKEAGIQKGIEQVTEERKERVSSIDKRNETIKRSLFEDYLNTKKINADLQQTQMRLNTDLETARMNNDTKMIKELEKEREQANKPLEKRLSILQEVKADMQAAGDEELEEGTRSQAKKNLKDNLRKLGKEKLADQISEAADTAKWWGSNYADESVLKLIDKEIEDTKLLLPQAASSSSGQGTSSGLVYIQAPNGQVAPVQASQVDKYLKKGGKVVAGPGGN